MSDFEGRYVVELFCGTFGWSAGFLERGIPVIGFDIEHQDYHGPIPEGAQLVLQDVLTLDGAQFKDAICILASPPCTEFSYLAMPWSRGKQIGRALRGKDEFPEGYAGSRTPAEMKALFYACIRIQIEASAAARRYIPLVIENVKGAQPWVGKAKANYGSFYLWGDIGMVGSRIVAGDYRALRIPGRARKVPGFRFDGSGGSFQTASVRQISPGWRSKHYEDTDKARLHDGVKAPGMSWSKYGEPGYKPQGFNETNAQRFREETKGSNGGWFNDNKRSGKSEDTGYLSRSGSKSDSRKAASAMIAKIPLALSRFVAEAFL